MATVINCAAANSDKNDGMMNENEERKTGFESIGERIEKLKGDIGAAEQTSRPEISKPIQEAKSEPAEKSPHAVYTEPIKYKPPFKLSFAKIFWGIVAIVVIASIFSQNTDRKKSNSAPVAPAPIPAPNSPNVTNDDFVTVGQYRCTQYHHNRAQELKPSDYEKQSIENESNALDSLKIEIETAYVDHYSQSSVDHYNMLINDYNSRLQSHQWNIDRYNNKVAAYNNYLMSNCSR
jgi:hypothetical protein